MRLRFNLILGLGLALMLSLNPQAVAIASPPPSAQITTIPVVGQGTLSVAFWDIYQATLRAPNGAYTPTQPFALSLTYLRNVSKKNLIKETKKQFKKMGQSSPSNIANWLTKLDELWVDVQENETITLYVDDEQYAHFYHDTQWLGIIEDPAFSAAFANIWLSENTSEPALRTQLLGENQ